MDAVEQPEAGRDKRNSNMGVEPDVNTKEAKYKNDDNDGNGSPDNKDEDERGNNRPEDKDTWEGGGGPAISTSCELKVFPIEMMMIPSEENCPRSDEEDEELEGE